MKTLFINTLFKGPFVLCAVFVLAIYGASPAFADDSATLKRLEMIIQQQQAQLEAQQAAIEDLKTQVEELKASRVDPTPPLAQAAPKVEKPEAKPLPKVAKTSEEKVAVKLYGHVNRAILFSNDGEMSKHYNVDNTNSQTRFGISGTAQTSENLSFGSKFEVGYLSNPANGVDQEVTSVDKGFNERIIEVFVQDKRYGKLSLGQGHTASDGTSEVDLSGTSVVGYSDIPGLAGGQLFWDKKNEARSTIAIKNVYSNMDGLGRDDRIRYDSPVWRGFEVSTSFLNFDGGDAALRYSNNFGDNKFAAAVAWATYGGRSDVVDNQFNGSASLLTSCGLNFTVAYGHQELMNSRKEDHTQFLYGKVGLRKKFFSLGYTAFSVDAGRHDDIQLSGDQADTIGVQLVQNFEKFGSDCYLGYRYHDLNRYYMDYNSINSVMSGLRVKF